MASNRSKRIFLDANIGFRELHSIAKDDLRKKFGKKFFLEEFFFLIKKKKFLKKKKFPCFLGFFFTKRIGIRSNLTIGPNVFASWVMYIFLSFWANATSKFLFSDKDIKKIQKPKHRKKSMLFKWKNKIFPKSFVVDPSSLAALIACLATMLQG